MTPRSRVLTAAPWLIGLAGAALLLALGGRYGHHRDEFYYLVSGLHPALGYVDNPPLTPWIGRAELVLFGDSPTALRVAPAIAFGLTVVVAGAMARELGGGPGAAAPAAGCTAGSAFPLATGHVLSTSAFDVLAWAVLCLLLIRALRDGGRVWLAVGAVAGVGLLNKTLVAGLLDVSPLLVPVWVGSVRPVGRVDNGIGLDNTEQGKVVWLCTDRRASWARLWPSLTRLA